MLIYKIGELGEVDTTLRGRGLAPDAVECLAGSLDGNVDICEKFLAKHSTLTTNAAYLQDQPLELRRWASRLWG